MEKEYRSKEGLGPLVERIYGSADSLGRHGFSYSKQNTLSMKAENGKGVSLEGGLGTSRVAYFLERRLFRSAWVFFSKPNEKEQ